ncbi:MAG: hypothetical protein ACP5I1_08835 [Candidatus Hinthialibacter sp.]
MQEDQSKPAHQRRVGFNSDCVWRGSSQRQTAAGPEKQEAAACLFTQAYEKNEYKFKSNFSVDIQLRHISN